MRTLLRLCAFRKSAVFCAVGPCVVARIVLENDGVRDALLVQIAMHDDRLVKALATMAAADKDESAITLPVKRNGVIESRAESIRRPSVRVYLAAENDSQIRSLEIVELAIDRDGN